uniref:Uncharacterized protein n=1 Tax=Plectus sambesii TaxID=2011161 RepID=A0A914VF98_9BILA
MAETIADRLEQDDTVAIVRRNGSVRVGVISKVFEETESDSSDSESDDDHDESKLKQGQVQVDWYPAGKSTKHVEDKLILLDRSLLLGEAVSLRSEPQKVGFITNMHVRGDIAVLPKRQLVFSNVDFDRIKFVTEYGAGAEESTKILYDSWVGNVEEC